jgi:DNA-binding SARP family transcriptional activator
MIEIRVLGAISVRADRTDGTQAVLTQPKRLALLLYLALAEPAALHARDRLLALLWPEADDRSARHALRNALHALRQALGDEAIATRGESFVGLAFDALRCDALLLRAHLAAGRLDEAVALWAGDLAPGFHVSGAPEFERWLEERREEARRAVCAAAWRRARELEGAGPAEVEALRRALRLAPGDEPGVRRLMRLLASGGDRAGALQAYDDLAAWFAREIGAAPSADTQRLAADLRAGSGMGARRATAPATGARPEAAGTGATAAGSAEPLSPALSTRAPHPSTAAAPAARRRVRLGTLAAGLLATLGLVAGASVSGRSTGGARALGVVSETPAAEAERAVLRLPARYRADTAAYRSYLRGLTLRFEFRFRASRDTFADLVEREPLYVPGLYGLAHAYIFTALNYLTDPDESWPKIDALANEALALDSTAASAWLALASEDMFFHPDLPRAAERLARARALEPRSPDMAGMWSVWFRFHGQMDSAVVAARLAHRLDPLSRLFARLVAKQLFFARRYEESREAFAAMFEDDPGWQRGYEDFAELYRAMGRPRDAVVWMRRARAAQGDPDGPAAWPAVSTDSAAALLLAADARRMLERLDRAVRDGQPVPPSEYALAYAALGDTLATLRWLDAMLAGRDSYIHQVRVDPIFDFVRADPRYRAWEARSGLPPLASPTAGAPVAGPTRLPPP